MHRALESARKADLVVKASGVGVFEELLEIAVLDLQAPATLDRVHALHTYAHRAAQLEGIARA